tara:strand:+ start:887 stop:1558 length:672 start_codon:yes stop_codon:yes gene_type:complete
VIEKILFCGYRDWALSIFNNLELSNKNFILSKSPKDLTEKLSSNNIKTILFIGWSWIVEEDVIDKYNCVCLHPSPLPKYRGGCPIQHQIMNNELESAVSLFVMDTELDHGPILWQQNFSLEGSLDSIFNRITEAGTEGLYSILNTYKELGNFDWGEEQDHSEATYYKRRKPEDSEIKYTDILGCTAEDVYNKVRALQDPYPNAYISCKDGTRLYITEAHHGRD